MSDFSDLDMGEFEQRLGELARSVTAADRALVTPPHDLWEEIRAAAMGPPASTVPGDGEVSELRMKRSSRRAPLALAAAAVLVLVGVFVFTDDESSRQTVVASVPIVNDDLPVALDGNGTATLVRDGNDLFVELDLPDLPGTDGFYEVWLIDTNVDGMVSLGLAEGDNRFLVPAGIDPAAFPVVDVSVEPVDGDPTHSGQSILRGVLNL